VNLTLELRFDFTGVGVAQRVVFRAFALTFVPSRPTFGIEPGEGLDGEGSEACKEPGIDRACRRARAV
jgi:hypothetical protein